MQWSFTTGAGVTSVTLSLRDGATGTAGDDLAVTQAGLYACQSRTVSGFVYRDANANGSRDGGETWSAGVNVRVKLTARTGTTCTGSALQNVLVGAGAGAYSFATVAPGDYCVVLNTAAASANITPSPPAGWFFTNPDTGVWHITVGIGGSALNFDFGLLNTARIGGRVFRDNGAPSGTANDGIQNGAEPGLPTITLTLTNCGATTYASVQTDANGDYDFAVPAGATTVCVVETNAGDHRSTGASVGTAALPSGAPTPIGGTTYTYDRTTDSLVHGQRHDELREPQLRRRPRLELHH